MNLPSPRLCRLTRATTGEKFGFHLTGQKNKPGQTSDLTMGGGTGIQFYPDSPIGSPFLGSRYS